MKTFSVQELKTYLNEDTPDHELMQIYGLSPDELTILYAQLTRAMANGSPYVHIRHDND